MIATIAKTFTFDAAHHLPNLPDGHKCKRMHGHTYRVTLILRGPVNQETGFVVDYDEIASTWALLHETLDHHLLNEVPGLEVPSTENLVAWIINRLYLPGLIRVRVEESSTTWCEADVG